jgi:hypothetical protein
VGSVLRINKNSMWLILVSPEQSIIAAGADFIKSKKD